MDTAVAVAMVMVPMDWATARARAKAVAMTGDQGNGCGHGHGLAMPCPWQRAWMLLAALLIACNGHAMALARLRTGEPSRDLCPGKGDMYLSAKVG